MSLRQSILPGLIAMAMICPAALADSSAAPTTRPAATQPAGTINPAIAPTFITLKMDDVKVDEVLAELSRQSGYALRPFNQSMWNARGNRQKISVNYQHQPFWSVVVDFSQKAQISPYFDGMPGRQILFMPAGQMGPSILNCPASDSGAMLILVTQLSRSRTISFGRTGTLNKEFNAQMAIVFEPKVHVAAISNQPTIDEAVDDRGNSLIIAGNSSQEMSSTNRQLQMNVSLPMSYPANIGTKISRLRGKVRLAVATRTETAEFSDFSNGKEPSHRFKNGLNISLVSVKPMDSGANGDINVRQYLVQIVVDRDSVEQQKYYDLTNNLALRVTDSQNRELQYQGNRETSTDDKQAKMTQMFYRRGPEEGGEEVGEPAKVAWEIATESQSMDVPFEFKDLLIP